MVYGSISTPKPRATHLFSSSLPRNKPAMTRQTPHAHATRCAHSDFNRFFLCTTFAGKLQTCFKIARCLQFSCKCYTKLNFTCSSPANMLQNYMMLAAFLQISHKLHFICRISASILQKHLSFAGLLQICYKNAFCLQKPLQACYKNAHCLQNFLQTMHKTKRCWPRLAQIPHAIVLHHRHNNLL